MHTTNCFINILHWFNICYVEIELCHEKQNIIYDRNQNGSMTIWYTFECYSSASKLTVCEYTTVKFEKLESSFYSPLTAFLRTKD